MAPLFILFCDDPAAESAFWRAALAAEPVLDVPGMTQFALAGGAALGLMPLAGIRRLLGAPLAAQPPVSGAPRAELYLRVKDAAAAHARALAAGAAEISPLQARDWGETAAYSLAPGGCLLAFAQAPAASR